MNHDDLGNYSHTEVRQLHEQVAALTKERDEQKRAADHWFTEANQDHNRLVAAQATIERLREALEAVETTCSYNGQEDEIGEHSCCHEPSYRPHSPDCWTHLRTKALALPSDTTALQERLDAERARYLAVVVKYGMGDDVIAKAIQEMK